MRQSQDALLASTGPRSRPEPPPRARRPPITQPSMRPSSRAATATHTLPHAAAPAPTTRRLPDLTSRAAAPEQEGEGGPPPPRLSGLCPSRWEAARRRRRWGCPALGWGSPRLPAEATRGKRGGGISFQSGVLHNYHAHGLCCYRLNISHGLHPSRSIN
ncbi:hypothetical protein ZWY2020_031216 [Hordeum vulgare]|nr:hypothetical protein ZWY2020_031216 [Hordeum vulgare]